MTTTDKVKKIWNKLANSYDIKLTPQDHEEIIGMLVDDFENFAEEKIAELGNIIKQLSKPGVR